VHLYDHVSKDFSSNEKKTSVGVQAALTLYFTYVGFFQNSIL
jgi:hypothetical protein